MQDDQDSAPPAGGPRVAPPREAPAPDAPAPDGAPADAPADAPPRGTAHWARVADEVAAELAAGAAQRDAAGRAPVAEVALLREHGLLALSAPRSAGGEGESWATVFTAVRRIARTDPSLAHLLGYHHLHSWRTRLSRHGADPASVADAAARVARLDAASIAQGWFWGGAGNPRDAGLELRRTAGGYLVRGTKHFATGAQVSDRVVASGTVVDDGDPGTAGPATAGRPAAGDDGGPGGGAVPGARLSFALPTATPGVSHGDDWDGLGQRTSASGSIRFEDALLRDEDVLGANHQLAAAGRAPAFSTLSAPAFHAALAQVLVGLSEGALAAAAELVRTRGRPWASSGAATAVEDPQLRARAGLLGSELRAAAALTDEACAAWAAAASRGWDLTWEERGEVSVALSAAKVVSSRVALEVTSGVFDLTGARAAVAGTAGPGLDRYWRDARTLTLHDPAAHKATEVGDHVLTGAHPEPSGYS